MIWDAGSLCQAHSLGFLLFSVSFLSRFYLIFNALASCRIVLDRQAFEMRLTIDFDKMNSIMEMGGATSLYRHMS